MGDIRGRSDEPSLDLESGLVAESCTPGYTQCSNNRIFILARGRGWVGEQPTDRTRPFYVDSQTRVSFGETLFEVGHRDIVGRMRSARVLEHKTSSDRN